MSVFASPSVLQDESTLMMQYAGFRSIIKGWLDPVVASKVIFTKNVEDLEKIIPRECVPKELDGSEE